MRRVGRSLPGVLAAVVVIGGSVLAAAALLDAGADPAPPESSSPRPDGVRAGEPKRVAGSDDSARRQPRSLLSADAEASWNELERELAAQLGASVVPLGRSDARSFGPLRSGHAWSTIKVPIVVTLSREEGRLDAEEDAWARAALTASDNEAAAALFARIEAAKGGLLGASEAVDATLRAAGDRTSAVATAPPPSGAVSTYGQTNWSLTASARFFASLAHGCLLDRVDTEYVLGLSEEVVPEQSWGLDGAGFDPGWRVALKGGWGPEGSVSGPYLVRQTGVVRHGTSGVAVAIAAQADSGSFQAGVDAVNRIAAWLADNLRDLGPEPHADNGCRG